MHSLMMFTQDERWFVEFFLRQFPPYSKPLLEQFSCTDAEVSRTCPPNVTLNARFSFKQGEGKTSATPLPFLQGYLMMTLSKYPEVPHPLTCVMTVRDGYLSDVNVGMAEAFSEKNIITSIGDIDYSLVSRYEICEVELYSYNDGTLYQSKITRTDNSTFPFNQHHPLPNFVKEARSRTRNKKQEKTPAWGLKQLSEKEREHVLFFLRLYSQYSEVLIEQVNYAYALVHRDSPLNNFVVNFCYDPVEATRTIASLPPKRMYFITHLSKKGSQSTFVCHFEVTNGYLNWLELFMLNNELNNERTDYSLIKTYDRITLEIADFDGVLYQDEILRD